MFEAVETNLPLPELENQVLEFWQKNNVFKKSLENRHGAEPYVFYDGPPFATGLPHYGHLLAGTIKDVIPRYQTMRGKYVERTFGWDCHGLPIESLAQNALGLAGATAIKECGIDKFNEQCRSMVSKYVSEWEQTVTRMGRWVDFRNGYKTMNTSYMESIWWVFQQLWNQGRVYKAHRIVPYSWKLCTPLSNFEANSNYKDVQDPAVTIRMRLLTAPAGFDIESHPTYICIWTTTPWTLPENQAVCVGPDIDYSLIEEKDGGDRYILADARIGEYYKNTEDYTVVKHFKGAELYGATYEPIFPYFKEQNKNGFKVLKDSYVTTTDGTGIVHQAPAYGEDDYRVCHAEGIELIDPLDEAGNFTALVPDFAGQNCKEADKAIIQTLKQNGKLVKHATIVHSYPFCERTETPLIYRAIDAWYVKVEDLRDEMLSNNTKVRWMPDYVGEKRFANWLADAKDWNISRNRFWGSCIPLWINVDNPKDIICVGSIAELEELSGVKVTDLHKHIIDKIEIVKDGKRYRRTPEVLDCWFESGSMPYAQHHYPFENKDKVEKAFPAAFIAEGLDQTRGWFYTLMIIGTALFKQPPYQNVIVNGLVLAEDGRKMSKRLKNYPDPMEVVSKYGADALRMCMLSSPVVRAEDLRFNENAVREVMRTVLLPLWNSFSFLGTYAKIDGWKPADKPVPPANPSNTLDRWILSKLEEAVRDVRDALDSYDLQRSALRFTGFIDNLTNWYIRRSRRRFWKSTNDGDKNEAYQTLHYVLLTFCQLAAPFIPFITETIYRSLRTEAMPESVHLCDYPEFDAALLDEALNRKMGNTMTAVALGRFLRTQTAIKTRQPLANAILVSANAAVRADLEATRDVIAEELNVHNIDIQANEEELVSLSAKPNLKKLGPKYGKYLKELGGIIANMTGADIAGIRGGNVFKATCADGTVIELGEEDILVQRHEPEGMTVANEGDITIALDTRLTPELIEEGWAREIVSKLQNLRKELDFEVTDRIDVVYHGPDAMVAAIKNQAPYICNETLAVSMTEANTPDGLHAVEMNGENAAFGITKHC